jgi:hypothetical protein
MTTSGSMRLIGELNIRPDDHAFEIGFGPALAIARTAPV